MPSVFIENGDVFFWLMVAIATAVIEGLTCGLVSIWFGPGALVALILALFTDLIWVQILVFLVLSLITLILFKTVFKNVFRRKNAFQANSDALIGAHGIVEETIDNIRETGSVKVRSLVWTARSDDDSVVIPAGSVVTVHAISGVKLICSAKEENT